MSSVIHWIERLVADLADAIVAVSDGITSTMRARNASARLATIPNGADFEDFQNLTYTRAAEQFRVTHAGSFIGKREPRTFLQALERVDGVTATFIGDSRAADREWAAERLPGGRIEWLPFAPRPRSLELQRDSEALLLLIPEANGRGTDILSGKVFEYLAAGRPILALVPPDGAAARLIRDTGSGVVVAPGDVEGAVRELTVLRDRWRQGDDLAVRLRPDRQEQLARTTRVRELASVLATVGRPRSTPAELDRDSRLP